jgi:hypothetical protein
VGREVDFDDGGKRGGMKVTLHKGGEERQVAI